MVTLFDDRTTLGLVRLRTEKVVHELRGIFVEIMERNKGE
jgi:hypothetical protein